MFSTETIGAYATHTCMHELLSRIHRPEADLVYYFVEGLLPEYRKHVMMQSPETVAKRVSNKNTLDTAEPVKDHLIVLNSAVNNISARTSTQYHIIIIKHQIKDKSFNI